MPLLIRNNIPPLLEALKKQKEAERTPNEDTIQVNVVVSKLAVFYERLRNTVDAQEEHLLTKAAIERVLRRKVTKGRLGSQIARPLLVELIRGSYLPNGKIPERIVPTIEQIVNRYIHLINLVTQGKNENETENFLSWSFHMMACEIEEALVPAHLHHAVIQLMKESVGRTLEFEDEVETTEKDLQILLAAHRAFMKSDHTMDAYLILKHLSPEWTTQSPRYAESMAPYIERIREQIEQQINHPLGDRLQRVMRRYVTIFNVLKDVLVTAEDPTYTLTHPAGLDSAVEGQYDERLSKSNRRLRGKASRSIVYLFMTKFLIALALEVPYDLFFHGSIQYLPLGINIIFHPLLLFFIAILIRPPRNENKQSVMIGVRETVYDVPLKVFPDRLAIRKPRVSPLAVIYKIVYIAVFLLVFAFIISLLNRLGFTILSTILFVFFLSVVSFFGLRIRHTAREILVIPRRDNIIALLVDFLTLPVLQLGRYVSKKFGQINVFVFILDFMIEAPFKAFIEMAEEWFSFVREQRDAID